MIFRYWCEKGHVVYLNKFSPFENLHCDFDGTQLRADWFWSCGSDGTVILDIVKNDQRSIELIQYMRVTIVSKRDFNIPSKENPANRVSGFMYGCFTSKGNAFEFSSKNGTHKVNEGLAEYDDSVAVNILIDPIFFDGKVKYRERKVEGQV